MRIQSHLNRLKRNFLSYLTPQQKRRLHHKDPIKHPNGSYIPINNGNVEQVNEYDLLEVIGKGSFGIVYAAMNKDGDLFAVKVKKTQKDPKILHLTNMFFEEEFLSLLNLNHPNILKLIGVEKYEEEGYTSIVMEHIEGTNLNTLIKQHKSIPETMIRIYTAQVLDGLAYIHQKNIIHRDIKSSNVMIMNNYHVKIIDFGMSKRVDASYLPQTDENVAGTVAYMAPEMVTSGKYDARIDVWGLGVLVFEMGFGVSYLKDERNKKINYKLRPTSAALKWHPFLKRDLL